MKRICAYILVAILSLCNCVVNAAGTITSELSDADIISVESYYNDVAACEKPIKKIGTTPRDAASFLSQTITDEEVSISTEIYNNILKQDPDLFLYTDKGIENLNSWDEMTDKELDYVRNLSEKIFVDCDNTDQKIYAAMKYVAENVGYDYDYYYHNTKTYEELNHSAYDVLTNESAVCYGYSAAVAALLQTADIPCIIAYSPEHAWNMAYNGERWILLDSTWVSNSTYEYGVLTKSSVLNEKWYDYTIETANSNKNHLLTDAAYCEYGNVVYSFPVHTMAKSFTIPENITNIGEYAFYGCDDVELRFNGVLENIEKCAFYDCDKLYGTVSIADATTVADYAFFECDHVNIKFGDKLSSIGIASFYDCEGICGHINLGNVSVIGDSAFINCSSIDGTLNLESIQSIGKQAFYNCCSIDSIILGKNLETIPELTFTKCEDMTEIFIPDSITSIGKSAFHLASTFYKLTVYYPGSENRWKAIDIGEKNYHITYAQDKGYIIYDYIPHIDMPDAEITDGGLDITFEGIPTDEIVYFAEYENGKFLGIKSLPLSKSMHFDLSDEHTNKVSLFVFDISDTFKPVAKSGSIEF